MCRVFIFSYSVNYLMTPEIYLVTPRGVLSTRLGTSALVFIQYLFWNLKLHTDLEQAAVRCC